MQEHRILYDKYIKFSQDPDILKMVAELLISDPLERTFSIEGELFNVNLINGIPRDRDVHLKIANIWMNYDKAARLAYY